MGTFWLNAMTQNVTEGELLDLRKKFHLLEGDRKAYYEMSMHTKKNVTRKNKFYDLVITLSSIPPDRRIWR